jgi:non-ribosomal peptide synthetase component F
LPLDRPRPERQSYAGASARRRLEPALASRIEELVRRSNATLFSVLLAGLTALLARASGDHRIIVGTPVATRSRPETEHLLGVFH